MKAENRRCVLWLVTVLGFVVSFSPAWPEAGCPAGMYPGSEQDGKGQSFHCLPYRHSTTPSVPTGSSGAGGIPGAIGAAGAAVEGLQLLDKIFSSQARDNSARSSTPAYKSKATKHLDEQLKIRVKIDQWLNAAIQHDKNGNRRGYCYAMLEAQNLELYIGDYKLAYGGGGTPETSHEGLVGYCSAVGIHIRSPGEEVATRRQAPQQTAMAPRTVSEQVRNKSGSPKSAVNKRSCSSGSEPQQCVKLEQRGLSGQWHNFRLVNSCDTAFSVNVFACAAKWAGGCEITAYRVGPCETTGSSSEGKQSWNRDAELRW